jgi:hypothetical protein
MSESNVNPILLDFANMEQATCKLEAVDFKTTDLIYSFRFYGNQIFEIGGTDFSSDFPIIGFARELFAIANKLKNNKSNGFYEDPDYQEPTYLEFLLDGDLVEVKRIRRGDSVTVCAAMVKVDDLLTSASEYLDRVIKHFSPTFPQLSHPLVQNWLRDYNLPGYGGNV